MIHVAAGIADFMWLLTRAALSLVWQLLVAALVIGGVAWLVVRAGRRRRPPR